MIQNNLVLCNKAFNRANLSHDFHEIQGRPCPLPKAPGDIILRAGVSRGGEDLIRIAELDQLA